MISAALQDFCANHANLLTVSVFSRKSVKSIDSIDIFMEIS